jgi:hypothetical protein
LVFQGSLAEVSLEAPQARIFGCIVPDLAAARLVLFHNNNAANRMPAGKIYSFLKTIAVGTSLAR